MSFKNLLANVCFLCIGGLLGFNFSPTATSDEPAQCQDACYRRTHSGFSMRSLSGESKVCHFK
ncbi:MAG: hypothetical protein KDD62_14540, partial [Bdellovibrionales bacterium]|nr:hypothetical protein [Bdellovibrionales bacterium]